MWCVPLATLILSLPHIILASIFSQFVAFTETLFLDGFSVAHEVTGGVHAGGLDGGVGLEELVLGSCIVGGALVVQCFGFGVLGLEDA